MMKPSYYSAYKIEDINLLLIEPLFSGLELITIINNGKITIKQKGKGNFAQQKQKIKNELERLHKINVLPDNIVLIGDFVNVDLLYNVSKIYKKEFIEKTKNIYHIRHFFYLEEYKNKKDNYSFLEKKDLLEDIQINHNSNYIKIIKKDIIEKQQLDVIYKNYLQQGHEGIIIKNPSKNYEFKTTNNCLIKKEWYEKKLKVYRFQEGFNKIDCLILKNKNKFIYLYKGFTKEEKIEIWNNRNLYRDKLVLIKYKEEKKDGDLLDATFTSWD